MKKRVLKYISFLLASVLLLFIFASCGQKVTQKDYFSDFPYPQITSPPVVDNENADNDFNEDNSPNETNTPNEPNYPDNENPIKPNLPEEAEPQKDIMLISLTDTLNIRSGAGTGYSSVGYIDTNDMVGYYGESGEWYETRYKGKVAYLSKKYTAKVEFNKGSERTEVAISIGKEMLGYPYLYGAVRFHDGNGNVISNFNKTLFDCSSLTQYIFYKTDGTLINTTTRTQSLQGSFVNRKDIQRGDLLFFTNSSRQYNSGIERIGHVAIYLGDNYILHTSSDYAVVEPISDLRWSYYITARRV